MLVICIIVRLSSPGPAIFRQARPGKGGEVFTLYKFRTMKVETEAGGVPLTDVERMTGVGRALRKTSLDELPQLFNVLSGKMSFIGPRPLLVRYLDFYTPEQMRRHDVLPGITGWAQVNGRNAITWEEKFKYDVFYVDNMSFGLDLRTFFMTISKVLASSGVNRSESETMPGFGEDKADEVSGNRGR